MVWPVSRDFTQLLKPLLVKLKSNAHQSIAYIDDFYLPGDSLVECQRNVVGTVELLTQLGFVIHREKSILHPTHRLTFMGFDLDFSVCSEVA